MTEEEQRKQIQQQQQEILAIRKELEAICEQKGYSLGQVCHGLAVDEYIEHHGSDFKWNGLREPRDSFLKATKLSEEEYWNLSPADRHKKLKGFPQPK
jgi:hypothetical protein